MVAYVSGLPTDLATKLHTLLPASIGVTGSGTVMGWNILTLVIVPIVFCLVIAFGKLMRRI